MFDIGPAEFLLLLVLAVILFGPERLPELARKAARMIRYVRTLADNAQRQLKDELGPDFSDLDVRDLHPKTFVRKHLLDDVEPIVADVKKDVMEASAVNGANAPSPRGIRRRRCQRADPTTWGQPGRRPLRPPHLSTQTPPSAGSRAEHRPAQSTGRPSHGNRRHGRETVREPFVFRPGRL